MNDWTFRGEVFNVAPEDCVSFVYCIENTTNGRKYIGKKQFWSINRKKVKGKKRKIKVETESDWKTYHGSSGDVAADVEKLGASKFKREILHLCKSKAECSYLEAKEQFDRNAILSSEYYNGQIRCRLARNQFKNSVAVRV